MRLIRMRGVTGVARMRGCSVRMVLCRVWGSAALVLHGIGLLTLFFIFLVLASHEFVGGRAGTDFGRLTRQRLFPEPIVIESVDSLWAR